MGRLFSCLQIMKLLKTPNRCLFIAVTVWLGTLVVLSGFSMTVSAGQMISYQGRLTTAGGTVLPDANYEAVFWLYPDSTTAVPVWAETATITTTNGLFDHLLGSISPLPIDLTQTGEVLYLEIQINSESLFPRTRLTAVPYSLSAANLQARDSTNSVTIVTDGNRGLMTFLDPATGDSVITLRSDLAGDSSVILPEGAISSIEISNEPGATWNLETSIISLSTGDMSDLVVISVKIPEEGYIVLYGKCYVMLSGTTGANGAQIQIDDTQGGVAHFPYYQQVGLSGFVNTGLNYFPVMTTRVFYLPAGSYDFRLEGLATHSAPAIAESWDHILVAQYFPTDIWSSGRSPAMQFDPNTKSAESVLSPEERYKSAKKSKDKD